MIKKSISFILCLSFLLSLVTVYTPVAYAVDGGLDIYSEDGRRVDSVELEYNEKVSLTAASESFALTRCRWQILYGGRRGIWVDIYDMDSPSCEISRAVVENMQNGDGVSYIRCMAEYDGEVYYSDAVEVTVGEPDLDLDPPHVTSFVSMPEMTADEEAVQVKKRYYLDSRAAEAEYVTVTIKYLDSASLSGVEASIYSPYVATIEKGSSFSQTVISPTFIGFAPYYDSIPDDGDDTLDDDASSITLNYPAVNENIEIKVYYNPIKVDFAIKYFFQNINDDLYTENVSRYHSGKEETGTIISDTYIIDHAGDTTGFEKMYHIPESVAADGSTVFECYYDRKYYLVQFDLNGGYGVEPIYARYGTPFVVNTPVKHGYSFAGWDLVKEDGKGDGIADVLPSTIPNENRRYIALWETVNTTYTIVYWKENADDNGYSFWGSEKKNAVSASKVNGSDSIPASISDNERAYFVYNDELTDKQVLVEGNGSTVVNVYYDRKLFTIRFNLGSVSITADSHTHTDGECNGKLICDYHVHDDSCPRETVCVITPHTHDSSCQYTCGLPVHEHSAACCTKEQTHTGEHSRTCWGEGVSNKTSTILGSPSDEEGYVYYSGYYRAKYIRIDGKWYEYTGDAPSGQVAPMICHVHGDGSCTYCSDNLAAHQHSESCYDHNEHYHDDECYNYNCGYDTHTHVDSCYSVCTRPEYGVQTIDGKRYFVITAKYEQTIGDIWPTAANFPGVNFYSWSIEDVPNDAVSKRVNMTNDLCDTEDNIKIATMKTQSSSTQYLYYMFESFDQTSPANGNERKQNGGKYYDSDELYYQVVNSDSSRWGQKAILGMTAVGVEYENNNRNVFLYYTRSRNSLSFQNVSDIVKTVNDIMYGYPIKDLKDGDSLVKDFVPEYPSSLEPNAYYFGGWYTTPECFPGTEYNFETAAMPNDNLTLYAKWQPKTHRVNFFSTLDEMEKYENDPSSATVYKSYPAITHGSVVGSVENPVLIDQSNMQLIFAGWFYIENGQKKAFSPLDMPINRDINLFADWSSSQPQPYRIDYRLLTQRDTAVAEPSTGFAYGGSTRTFVAKAGNPYNQLYPTYNSGYFPTVGSHSITIQYEEDKTSPQNNVYTFYYVQAQNIKYTIRYVNKENNTLIGEEVVKVTGDAVVTERFKPIENMVPDAFYKRLVISVKQDEHGNYVGTEDNVITFYYTPNKTSAYYAVHFMLENIHDPGNSSDVEGNYKVDGTGGYTSTGTHLEGIGDVGKNVSITPQSFPGFTLIKEDAAQLVTGGNITGATKVDINSNGDFPIPVDAQGSELYLFYKRNEYNYTVHHYIYNTTEQVSPTEAPDENGTAPYGSLIEASAKKVTGYTCVSVELTDTIEIKDKAEQNVIIFYYSPLQYVAEYVAVPPEGGWLSSTIEVIAGKDSLSGSVPTPDGYYEFGGWFIDEACTVSASDYGTVDEDTNRFVPHKEKLSETERNIFYAKFNSRSGDLTVSRRGAEDDGQVFVYEIKNDATGDTIYLTVSGNGSATVKDLVFGEYTVTQQNGWSWRYSDTASAVSHSNVNGTTVLFGTNVSNEKWLNGNSAPATNVRGNG